MGTTVTDWENLHPMYVHLSPERTFWAKANKWWKSMSLAERAYRAGITLERLDALPRVCFCPPGLGGAAEEMQIPLEVWVK